MPGWIIRPADEVVQGNIEEVGKGDENGDRWNHLPVFVGLKNTLSNAGNLGSVFLGHLVFFAEAFQGIG